MGSGSRDGPGRLAVEEVPVWWAANKASSGSSPTGSLVPPKCPPASSENLLRDTNANEAADGSGFIYLHDIADLNLLDAWPGAIAAHVA